MSSRLGMTLVLVTTLVSVSTVGVVGAATTGLIYACVNKDNGNIRIIAPTAGIGLGDPRGGDDRDENARGRQSCTRNEVAVSWSQFGAPGASGATGATGPQGPAGASGATGPQGASGVFGPSGATGALGPAGPTGAAGATGPAGATGAAGAAGASGATGPQGPIGPAGPTGAAGASGAQGAIGPVGPTGAVGATGPAGATGAEGATGASGASGQQGATGPIGPSGGVGATGAAGATGASGASGAEGATGGSGASGTQGLTGLQGPKGDSGVAGVPGTPGATGASGTIGSFGSLAGLPCDINGVIGSVVITYSAGGTATIACITNGISFNPASHDYGVLNLGQTVHFEFKLENFLPNATSGLYFSLTGPQAPQFSLYPVFTTCPSTGGLAGNSSCDVAVRFTPTSTAAASATLRVSETAGGPAFATATLTGSAGGTMQAFNPTTHDFGAVILGSGAPNFTFYVNNFVPAPMSGLYFRITGPQASYFTASPGSQLGALPCSSSGLPAAIPGLDTGTCLEKVTFLPLTNGPASATLIASETPGGPAFATATLTATVSGTMQAFNPTTHDFGVVSIGQSASFTFFVNNFVPAAMRGLYFTLSGKGASQFSFRPGSQSGGAPCSSSGLPAAIPGFDTGTCLETVIFTPTASGTATATLSASETPEGPAFAIATLTGTAP